MMHRLPLVLLLAVTLTAGCRAVDPELPGDAAALEMRAFSPDVMQYFHSGSTTRERLVIRDEAAWTQFWTRLTSHIAPPPARPAVDFSQEMVVVAAMGERPSGGYAIHIDSMHADEARIYVVVREVSPGPRCMVTAAITAPVAAVRIPRRSGAVTFIERTEVRDC